MRCLIVSDIHANLPAFEAVMRAVKQRAIGYDIVWCLGDVLGYGANPNECVELLRTMPHECLPGNHDYAVLNRLDLLTFHDAAAKVVRWTQATLLEHNRKYLEERAERLTFADYTLVHGSPREPIWEYVLDVPTAEDNFALFPTSTCLVGHTHVPVIFVEDGVTKSVRVSFPEPGVVFSLRKHCRYILNPGAVGQPRDGDPRASFAVLDTDKRCWTLHRVEYDIKAEQDFMRKADFPARLIDRLDFGR